MEVTEVLLREDSRRRLEEWNRNANVATIARELIEAEIATDSQQFAILGEEFQKFFAGDPNAALHWEIIGQIVEEFA